MRCTAKSKRSQQQCQHHASHGFDKCHLHGGKSLVGPALHSFKTGRYSKFLPVRMADKYHAALKDPELLSLKDEIASIDARLAELFTRVDSGESGAIWNALQAEWATFLRVRQQQDVARMHGSIEKLDGLFARKLTDHDAWAEISEKIEERRRLVDSETKRLVSSQQVLNQTEAMLYMGAITDVITRNVTDKKVLSQMLVELQVLMIKDQVPVYGELPA